MTEEIDIFVCAVCGGEKIREAMFVWYNTREEIDSVFGNIWCEDCDAEVEIVDKEEYQIEEGTHETTQ